MEKFCTLTVDRGDREQFLKFCRHQISKFTVQPAHSIFVTEPPTSEATDMTLRIRKGLVAAQNLGIDIVYIVESDDAYPADYIERMWIAGYDFIGSSKTIYYNLRNKTYQQFDHPRRSSMFQTAFRISALDKFQWPADDTMFLDLILWKYALTKNYLLLDEPLGVGIKHGVGKTAGVGHRAVMGQTDNNNAFLRLKVGDEAFKFYQTV